MKIFKKKYLSSKTLVTNIGLKSYKDHNLGLCFYKPNSVPVTNIWLGPLKSLITMYYSNIPMIVNNNNDFLTVLEKTFDIFDDSEIQISKKNCPKNYKLSLN